MSRAKKLKNNNQVLTMEKRNSNKKIKRSRKIGIILADILLIIALVFLGLLMMLNILPLKYLIAVILVLVFFVGYAFLSQLTKRYRMVGKVLAVILSIVLSFGIYYLIQTGTMFSKISGSDSKIDEMLIVVLEEDPAESINDAIDYTFGINEVIDRDKSEEVIENINKELDTKIDVKTYVGYDELVNSLYNKESGAIVVNDAFKDMIYETHPDFEEKTRVLGNYDVETAIPTPKANDKDITKEPFNVYISGMDNAGSIKKTSRSDVNIIATINPETKQVLLTSTPRDYYIPLTISKGMPDKLTHAGNYGIDVSVGTLEELYDIEIDYHVKVNFTTLIDLVDTLGGISAYSEYSFKAGGYSFDKGYNDMDGDKALVFSRERSSFGLGDMQRGKNQMEVIKGIVNKALSPAIITNYGSIMNDISGSFETNMSNDRMTNLVRMQIDEMATWNIISNTTMGKGGPKAKIYSMKSKKSVVYPDQESIDNSKHKINQVMNGETLVQE